MCCAYPFDFIIYLRSHACEVRILRIAKTCLAGVIFKSFYPDPRKYGKLHHCGDGVLRAFAMLDLILNILVGTTYPRLEGGNLHAQI